MRKMIRAGKRVGWILPAFAVLLLLAACAAQKEQMAYNPRAEELAKAVISGNSIAFRKGVDKQTANAVTKKKVPLTVLAAAFGRKDMLETLLANGADPDACDSRNVRAIHVAAGKNFVPVLELLLKKGAIIDSPGYYDRTALMEAGRCGSKKAFDFLLKNGADRGKKDALGRTVLMYVCMGPEDQADLVKKLLDEKVNTEEMDENGHPAVYFAAERGYTESAKLLLEKYPSFDIDGELAAGLLAMKGAIRGSDKKLAKYILDKKLPLNRDPHIARVILKRISTSGIYRLMARNEMLDIRRAPLLIAAKENNLEMVKFFLENGASALQKDEKGYDALSLATDRNVISFLKKKRSEEIRKNRAKNTEEPIFRGRILGN